jgi:hypothetical protein
VYVHSELVHVFLLVLVRTLYIHVHVHVHVPVAAYLHVHSMSVPCHRSLISNAIVLWLSIITHLKRDWDGAVHLHLMTITSYQSHAI